jgi:hypothetical protein
LFIAAWVSIDSAVIDRPVYSLSYLSLLILPLCIGIAAVRYNVFDIDRLLSATASYNVLLVILLGASFLLAPRIAEAASVFLGIEPITGQIALSLALAGAVVPAHRRLRPRIDRLFFKERFAVDRGIAELLTELSLSEDARDLTHRAGGGIHRLFRPEACVVYAGVDDTYVPVFAEGRAVPPAYDAMSPLIRTLGARRAPLALGDAGRRRDEAALGPFDRAALETLDAEVVLPVHREGALAASARVNEFETPTFGIYCLTSSLRPPV